MTQAEIVLAAFKAAPGKKLTTAQIDAIPFMTNQRARISDLRKQGYIISCKRIKGKNQSMFEYLGQIEMICVEPPMKTWFPIGNGFEVQL